MPSCRVIYNHLATMDSTQHRACREEAISSLMDRVLVNIVNTNIWPEEVEIAPIVIQAVQLRKELEREWTPANPALMIRPLALKRAIVSVVMEHPTLRIVHGPAAPIIAVLATRMSVSLRDPVQKMNVALKCPNA